MLKFSNIGLSYTLTCPLSCRDCIVESGPKVQGKMDPVVAQQYLDVLPKFSGSVCFTGGEPLLYYNEIVPLIRHAKSLGLMTSLVTGAGWARTNKPDIAKSRIFGLKEAGLDGLLVSWDVYHEEFCSPDNPLMLLDFANQAGLHHSVRGVVPKTGAIARIEQELVKINVPYHPRPVVRLGAAMNLPDEHFTLSPDVEAGRCMVVDKPNIEPSGWVYACCGPSRKADRRSALVLGNTFEENLESILQRAANDPILEAIYLVGPYALFRMLKNDPEFADLVPTRDQYTTMCETCLDINDIPELVQKLRQRLTEDDMRAMMMAAKLYHQATPEVQTSYLESV